MKRLKIIGLSIALILLMWISGFIPKGIATIYGQVYVHHHYPEMDLSVDKVEWNKFYGDYVIYFVSEDGEVFNCVIGPRFFPVSIGQGIIALNDYYNDHIQK